MVLLMIILQQQKSFANSNFKTQYESVSGAQFQDQLMAAVRSIILAYCSQEKMEDQLGIKMFEDLQKQVFESKDGLKELVQNVSYAAQRYLKGCPSLTFAKKQKLHHNKCT